MNSYARFFENLQQDLKSFIYWCLVFTVFRIAFIAIYSGQLNGDYSDIPMALLLGLRLSLKTAGIIALIGFVFATLPKIIVKIGRQTSYVFAGSLWPYFSLLFVL